MIQKDVNGFDRILEISPAYDKRDADPKKNYGIGNVLMKFILKGPEGAVQFYFSTGMSTPEVHKEMFEKGDDTPSERLKTMEVITRPMGYDLGYHSLKPMYEGQEAMGTTYRDKDGKTEMMKLGDKELEMPLFHHDGEPDPCIYLDGKSCYYDGSGLNADPVLNIFLKEGEDAVWKRLEEYYKHTFNETD